MHTLFNRPYYYYYSYAAAIVATSYCSYMYMYAISFHSSQMNLITIVHLDFGAKHNSIDKDALSGVYTLMAKVCCHSQ